jgi:hypothetical protein
MLNYVQDNYSCCTRENFVSALKDQVKSLSTLRLGQVLHQPQWGYLVMVVNLFKRFDGLESALWKIFG